LQAFYRRLVLTFWKVVTANENLLLEEIRLSDEAWFILLVIFK